MARSKDKDKSEIPQAVRGMRDLLAKEYYQYQGFFEKAAEIALYYGFKPIETPVLEDVSLYARGIGESTDIVEKEIYTLKTKGGDTLALRPEGTAGIMRAYLENGLISWSQPIMLYHYGPYFRHDRPQAGRYREFRQFGLEVIGSEKSITDAMVMKILVTILDEVGVKGIVLDVNSIGDKECRSAYRRTLLGYYRKHLGSVCATCKIRYKNNPLRMLDCKEEKCQPIKAGAPDSVSFLCPPCKQHFKEVLEYLETLGIEYRMKSTLVRGLDYYSRTVFEISAEGAPDEDEKQEKANEEAGVSSNNDVKKDARAQETIIPRNIELGGGGRFDYLARAIGAKRDVPSVGGALGVDRILLSKGISELTPRILKQPKVFFIQLGFEAKLHSLIVTEILRKARIPIAQSLSKDSLSVQLGTAERLRVPYAIILGQKEVIDRAVIVRNMDTRSQEVVPFDKLAEYIKKLK